MKAEQIFDHIETTLQQIVNQEADQHIRIERENRGTYPSLIIRVLPGAVAKITKGSRIISSVKSPAEGTPQVEAVPDVG
jgi:hypothetical protein